MKIKTKGKNNKRIPVCPKCGKRKWRRQGLKPTNLTGHASKGYHNKRHPCYFPEAMNRLFAKKYVCMGCKTTIRFGNAGRNIT